MSKRQALGVISNNYNSSQTTSILKPADKNVLKHSHSSHSVFNDENEHPLANKKSSGDFDFEIFQEECSSSDQQKYTYRQTLKAVEANHQSEYEATKDDDEEGICRLKFAAIIDSNKDLYGKSPELMSMTDGSQNDQCSPMILDDTIKFQSYSSDQELAEEDDSDDKARQIIQEREELLVNCNDYKDEILSYMRLMEQENRPKPNYMKKQTDITSSMRSILVDWLVEVSEEYKLNVETLYLAVNYTDRFLSQMSVLRGKLQLVGTAGMYIAAKYEEISPPDVNEFVYITDDTYDKKQVLRMEHLLLKVLDFRMNAPTTNCFLTHYLRFLKMTGLVGSAKAENLARYLAELTLIESETFLEFLPSQIAASAIYLSLFTLGKKWSEEIAAQVGYDFDLTELKQCIVALHKTMQQAESLPQQAIQEKYKQAKYSHVALIDAPESLHSFVYQ